MRKKGGYYHGGKAIVYDCGSCLHAQLQQWSCTDINSFRQAEIYGKKA